MIKKILLSVVILLVIVLAGWKLFFSKSDISKKLDSVKDELTSYHMEANMELMANDETRSYFVITDFQRKDDKDFFRVSMLDKNINQTQIMLKNDEGVYVLTPILNQVYKFKGDWPLNSPKPYLYHSLIDLFDSDHEVKKNDDGYILKGKATYPNSPNWVNQEVQFSTDFKPLSVNILDESNNTVGKVTFTSVDMKPNYSEDYFSVESNMNKARESMIEKEESSSITFEDLPLLPVDSSAVLEEKTVSVSDGDNRIIMTFSGKYDFTMVQGIAKEYDNLTVEEIDMEYVETINGVAFQSGNRVMYQKNGVTFDIYSESMTVSEIIQVINTLQSYDKR